MVLPGRGYTSGQALALLRKFFKQTMPKRAGLRLFSLSYQEKGRAAGGPTFALAIIFVFLLLAAMYESWRLPWAVRSARLSWLSAHFRVWPDGLRQ